MLVFVRTQTSGARVIVSLIVGAFHLRTVFVLHRRQRPDACETSLLHFFSFLVLMILGLVVEDGAQESVLAAIEGGDSK